VIATIRPDGSPHTAATWYLWVDGRVLVNMDEGRRRLEHLREEPRVSITVLGREDWYHHVTPRGHVADLVADPQFSDIDRVYERYTGRTYPQRDRGRVSVCCRGDVLACLGGGRAVDGRPLTRRAC
jgi:PPOX class probable F420-dependent enzyme